DLAELHARRIELQRFDIRQAPDRADDAIVRTVPFVVRAIHPQGTAVAADALGRAALVMHDAFGLHHFAERAAEIGIEARQQTIAREQLDVRTQRAQHARQFHADVTATDDADALRTLAQLEEPVGVDGEFAARQVIRTRTRTRRDDDVRRVVIRAAGMQR